VEHLSSAEKVLFCNSGFEAAYSALPLARATTLVRNDFGRFVTFRSSMIERGVDMLPVNLKRNHISLARTDADIDRALGATEDVLRRMT